MDSLTQERRSWNMRQIRSKDTKPEILIRKALWRMGYRFRIHYKKLPGKPDVVIIKHKLAIFIHGCFWHRHDGCIEASKPKTNSEYWENKISKTMERDKEHNAEIIQLGWRVIIIWECEIRNDVSENKKLLQRVINA